MRALPSAPARLGPRTEWKVLLPEGQVGVWLDRCRAELRADPHAQDPEQASYIVDSVYFDTPELHACGADDFPKYRSRRYDGASPSLHFEEKYSHRPLVWKRRQACSPDELAAVGGSSELVGPMGWFQARLASLALQPQLAVRYRRRAFHDGNGLRVTFDDRIEVAPATSPTAYVDGANALGHGVTKISGTTVLEVKFAGGPPPFAEEILASVPEPAPYSKYRTGMRALDRI